MALRTGQLTTTAGAQKLVQAEGRRRGLIIQNTDAAIHVRIGAAGVAANSGLQVRAGTSQNFIEGPFPQEEWWVIPESGTPIVTFAESLL